MSESTGSLPVQRRYRERRVKKLIQFKFCYVSSALSAHCRVDGQHWDDLEKKSMFML